MRKGTAFESDVVAYLAAVLGDDRIERRARNGANDRGDVAGVRTVLGGRVVVECKNHNRLNLAGWVAEAEIEKGNDDATVAVVVHKRRGVGAKRMGDTYVTLTLHDLAVLLGAET